MFWLKPRCLKNLDRIVVISSEKSTIYIVNEAFTEVFTKMKFKNFCYPRIKRKDYVAGYSISDELIAIYCSKEEEEVFVFRIT